jgi:hypothetical protein
VIVYNGHHLSDHERTGLLLHEYAHSTGHRDRCARAIFAGIPNSPFKKWKLV